MNIKNKKSFIKTVEILLVIIITTIFSLTIIQRQSISSNNEQKNYLISLENNQDFREFIINNEGCFNQTNFFDNSLIVCINTQQEVAKKPVYVETLFFSGNETNLRYKIIYLYKK